MKLHNSSLFRQQCYVDGQWVDADTGDTIPVTNPVDGSLLGTVPKLGVAETRRAIDAAEAAWPAWRGLLARERARITRRWFELIVENQEDLATIMTLEEGKPVAESRGEIAYSAGFVEWFSEEANRVYGDTIPETAHGRRIVVIKQPVGVVAAITPWNFPSAMITRKAAPALASGCPIVVKPASYTPYSALALAELAERAGVPKGVFNVITGPAGVLGEELTASPKVRKFSFTGSTTVGKQLLRQCASTMKKVSFELGGNAPFIVFDDADVDAAVEGTMGSKFRNMGQTCVCANRILVQEGVFDEYAGKLTETVARMKVGNGMDEGVTVGPLIDTAGVEKVERHIRDAVAKGAKIATGGKRHALGGTFFEPTVLTDITEDMVICHEETFGPVAPLYRFDTEEEAIRLANNTEYGLGSYVYTRDLGRTWRLAEAIEAGIVCFNEGVFSTPVAPFGGLKESGIGREGSKYGMEEFLEVKYVLMGGIGT